MITASMECDGGLEVAEIDLPFYFGVDCIKLTHTQKKHLWTLGLWIRRFGGARIGAGFVL